MAKESCIEHPKGLPFIIIKQSYVNLFGGDHAYAALMYCFEHFTNSEIDRIDRSGEDIKPWVSAPMTSIVSQATGLFSERSLRPRIDALERLRIVKVEKGRLGTPTKYLLDQEKVNGLLRSRRVFSDPELDGSSADEKESTSATTSEATSATTSAELPTVSLYLNTQKSESEKDLTPTLPSLSEENYTARDVINELNSWKGFRCSPKQRRCVNETDLSDMTLSQATAHFREVFKKPFMPRSNGGGDRHGDFRGRSNPEPNLPSMELVAPDEIFDQYIGVFAAAGKPMNPDGSDKAEARKVWLTYGADDREGACRNALEICMKRQNVDLIPMPASHLAKAHWRRVAQPRTLPMMIPNGEVDVNAEVRRLARAKGYNV